MEIEISQGSFTYIYLCGVGSIDNCPMKKYLILTYKENRDRICGMGQMVLSKVVCGDSRRYMVMMETETMYMRKCCWLKYFGLETMEMAAEMERGI